MEKITNQIKFIGGALSFIIMVMLLSILYINQTSKKDSKVINIAGKQRMLTQKISKAIFRLSTAENPTDKHLKCAVDEFDKNLNDLINGNKKRGFYVPPNDLIKNQLIGVKELWIPFKSKIDNFDKTISELSQTKKYVYEKNIVLLILSDSIVKEMVKNRIDGKYIDLSGRQRMLSQRMIAHLLLYLNNPDPEYYSEFFITYRMYNETIENFSKTKELTEIPALKKLIENNLKFWKEYSVKAKLLIHTQSDINEIISYVENSNIALLNTMDQAVSMYTVHSESQRYLIEKIEYFLGVIALLIMLYSAFLTIKTERHFKMFLNKSKNLTAALPTVSSENSCEYNNELSEADNHLQNFITNLDTMILDAQKSIQTSEKITNELSNMSDLIDDNDIEGMNLDEKKKKDLLHFMDSSEDVAIQSFEELRNSEKMLQKLHENLYKILNENRNKVG